MSGCDVKPKKSKACVARNLDEEVEMVAPPQKAFDEADELSIAKDKVKRATINAAQRNEGQGKWLR